MGTLKTQSLHTPHRGVHTQSWELKVLTRHSTGHTHRGTMKVTSPNTLQHRDHTQGSFVENLKVSTHHNTWSTHKGALKTQSLPMPQHSMGTLKLKVFIHHTTEPTPRGTLKIQSPHTPQHRAHTQGNFEKTQSIHTPQDSAHTQGNYFPYREIFRKNQSLPAREFFLNPQHRDFS